MNAKVNNQVRALNEVINNQIAFERFCKLAQRGYYIHVELKSKLKEKASLWITASLENDEKEEIHLLVNQEVLNIVICYLETGKLEDFSEINPNDLESFNERDVEFKRELFQNEKGKGKKVIWSYNVMGKLASMQYNYGAIIFHPYYYPVRETKGKNFVGEDYKEEKRKYPIVKSWFLEDSPLYKVRENKEVIDTDFDSNYSLHPCSLSGTFAPAKKEESLLVNKPFINNKNSCKMVTKNFTPANENENEVQTSSINTLNEETMNLKKDTKIEDPMKKELRKAKGQKEIAGATMKLEIMERTAKGYTIREEYRKLGLIKENRKIKDADVNGFLQVIANGKYDDTQSIVVMEAVELIGKYNITDLEGNQITAKEAKDFLIVLEGQHRTKAFAKLNAIRTFENQITIPNVRIKTKINVREYLADINMVGHNWSMADKVCVSAISTENKLLLKVNELIKAGYNVSTATLICTGKRLKNSELKALLSKGDTSCLKDEKVSVEERLERAEKFITTAMTIQEMTPKILTKRYFIKGFNSYAISIGSYDTAFSQLAKLTIEDFKETKEDEDFIEKLRAA